MLWVLQTPASYYLKWNRILPHTTELRRAALLSWKSLNWLELTTGNVFYCFCLMVIPAFPYINVGFTRCQQN